MSGTTRTSPEVVGLTGGIGSGKTVATVALRGAGYTVIDADEISRRLTARGSKGEAALLSAFPAAAENGALCRAKLRRIIADDEAERRRLNALTHAEIIAQIKTELSAAPRPCIISAPLLFETELARLCDVTVCVTCPPPLRIERVCRRDGVTEADARRMLDAQMPDERRIELATYTVSSDCAIDRFAAETVALFDRIFGRPPRE